MSRLKKTLNRKQQKLEAMLQAKQLNLPFPEPQDDVTPAEYSPSLCIKIIRHCKNGGNIFEFASELNVSTSVLIQWAEENPEFAKALDIAITALKAFWLKLAERECKSRFSMSIWKNLMLNLFGSNNIKENEKSLQVSERCVVILPALEDTDEKYSTDPGKRNLEAPAGPAACAQIKM